MTKEQLQTLVGMVAIRLKLNSLLHVEPSAIQFAEGWLSAGHSGFFWSGWNGARYAGYSIWIRPIKAIIIARDMKSRGLFRGFDIHSLNTKA